MSAYDNRSDEELEAMRAGLVDRLADCQDFTPGSFQVERKCGRKQCHCAADGDPGHGPRYSVMRYEAGKTVKKGVPAAMADEVQDRVARWHEFQQVCAQIADINQEVSRRLLAGRTADGKPRPGAKKGGSVPGGTII